MSSRQPPTSVAIDVPDGHGVIEVTGDAGGSLLLLADDPVFLEANDGCGSVGWLAARASAGGPGLDEVKYLTKWLGAPGLVPDPRTGRVEPPDPECLRPLLALLSPGRYVMRADVAPHHLRVVHPRAHQVQQWYADEDMAPTCGRNPSDTPPPPPPAVPTFVRGQKSGRF